MGTIVARFSTRHEADFAQGLLIDAGIPAGVFADDIGGTLPRSAAVRVEVMDEHAQQATRLLAEHGLLPQP